ncbi:MAG: adenine phosphoribosyltransferase [Parcubacteria group bacterium Gr01-1014_19]|nr:MAG: adenine phosphoribosyltransferase [Parcubacteria group bacterium Gr01-1014_19]
MHPLSPELEKEIRASIKFYLDFPEPGVGFLDIGPLLKKQALRRTVLHYLAEGIREHCFGSPLDSIAMIEARGFALGEGVADILQVGEVMVRKQGKLPGEVIRETYSTEYKKHNVMEIQTSAIEPGERVLLFDDVIATGGTIGAAHRLVTRLGGRVVGAACLASIESIPALFEPQQAKMKALGLSPFRLLKY